MSVGYSAGGGTASPARDYTPVTGTLSFGASQTSATFVVPVVEDSSATASPTVALALSQPKGGASVGPISTATLTITEMPPASTTSPAVISEAVATNGLAITAVVFGFSKPLDPNRATQLSNYGYYVYSAGSGSSIPLRSAIYNSTSRTVRLVPSTPLPLNAFYQITIDGHTSPFLNNGLTDTYGNLLAGSGGTVATPFVATFGVGTSLVYADGAGNTVTLKLSRGGLMEMFRSPSGAVEQLQLVGVAPGKTTLTGSLSRGPGGSGRSLLPPITGATGVRIKLKSPPFFYRVGDGI